MRVFVAGASGAIGRPLVRELFAAGHDVTGMTRSEPRAKALRAAGATGVVCDAFDADALSAAVAEARPRVVINQLTALPDRFDPRDRAIYEPTNRLRIEGTRNLLAAAAAAGAERFICQSIAFSYRPADRPDVKQEDGELFLDAPAPFGSGVRAVAEMERMVLEAAGLAGLVLRYGWLYGPGTYYGDGGSIVAEVRKRRYPIVGDGAGLFSFLHVDDAASATAAAVERGGPGVYNVVDDEPAALRDWVPAYAAAIGAKRPLRVPVWLARLVAGPTASALATRLPGASNAKAKRELAWQPQWASWREGFSQAPR